MDYYQPPTDHPNALEMERLQEQLDALVKQRQHLETLDFTRGSRNPTRRHRGANQLPARSRQGDPTWMTPKTFTTSSSSMSKSRL
jgi:hypothetical protein